VAARLEEAAAARTRGVVLSRIVRAAGGVVARRDAGGKVQVLVVHRGKYNDWTFPKGKAHRGERDEDCALREVEEETGLRCELEDELVGTAYQDSRGRQKRVRYWAMRPVGGTLRPSDEVDAARWVSLAEAEVILTYDRDLEVLGSFLATPA
jgi:8-oxo-dGTP pyrophosphatase MutT (NUDIX family)